MVNVAMLSRNRFRLLEQSLASLYANTPRDQFNVTVVDDGSDCFKTKRLLRKYAGDNRNFALVEVENSVHVLAQLKNLAVGWSSQRFGRGDWLHLGDSDVCFLPGWLSRLTAAAETSEMDIRFRLWGGQIHPFHHPIKQIAVDMTEHEILDGPSWLMRWKTWNEIGPFSRKNNPGVCQSEEFPFCERLIKAGGRIGVISPHVVIHTGLTNSDGKDAPGRKEREAMIPEGVLAE